MEFECDYETNLIQLYEEIKSWTYEIGKSIAFIVDRPVKREIFAGDFRDRIVHHYIVAKINPILEKVFIHDSYSCRKEKGTLFGVQRIDRFIRSATENYSKDAYILKLDILGFFMNISHDILLSQIRKILDTKYFSSDKEELFALCEKVVRNDPTKNCIIKGERSDWVGLPKSKSLFFSRSDSGLPIGNFTSQIFANLYLHELDVFIKKKLKIKYYGRYVDDFILIHENHEYLKSIILDIRSFLSQWLELELHPRKIYFQHYRKGVAFLGTYIVPHAIYVGSKMKTNFYKVIGEINNLIEQTPNILWEKVERLQICSVINSYLGLMRHYDTFRIRKKLVSLLTSEFWNYFYVSDQYRVVVEKSLKDNGECFYVKQ